MSLTARAESLRAVRCGGRETGCMKGGVRCATHNLWDALGGQIESFLSGVSLEDVAQGRVGRPAVEAA